jgi:sugar phosphate isomerase/epimerase
VIPVHQRISVHHACFNGSSLSDFVDHCRALGVGRLSFASPQLLAPGGLEEAARALAGGGLALETICHPFLAGQALDGDCRAATDTLLRLIDEAQRLGAKSVYLLTGGRGALDWEEAARRFSAAVEPCLAAARERGLGLMIECAPAQYADLHIAHSLADAITLAELSGVGVCIELSSCWAEADLRSRIERALPRCGLVQVSDYVLGDRGLPARAVPGDGTIPLERILGWLLEAGYSGALELELIGPRIDAEGHLPATRRAIRSLHQLLLKLGA